MFYKILIIAAIVAEAMTVDAQPSRSAYHPISQEDPYEQAQRTFQHVCDMHRQRLNAKSNACKLDVLLERANTMASQCQELGIKEGGREFKKIVLDELKHYFGNDKDEIQLLEQFYQAFLIYLKHQRQEKKDQ